jgi:hypothetical protein
MSAKGLAHFAFGYARLSATHHGRSWALENGAVQGPAGLGSYNFVSRIEIGSEPESEG